MGAVELWPAHHHELGAVTSEFNTDLPAGQHEGTAGHLCYARSVWIVHGGAVVCTVTLSQS